MQQLYISSLKFVELFPLFFIFYFIVFLSNVRPKRLFSLIRALTPPPTPLPKDCLCLHSGLHSYLCAKMSKKL